MNSNSITNGIINAVLKLLCFSFLIYLIYNIKELIIYLCIASVLALIGRPMVIMLKRKLKLSSFSAASITLLSFIILFLSLFSLFIPLIYTQGDNLSLLNVDDIQKKFMFFMSQISDFTGWGYPFIDEEDISNNSFFSYGFEAIPNILNSFVGLLSNFTIGLFSVIFALFFFLRDSKILEKFILVFVKENYVGKFKIGIEKIKNLLSRYFIGLVVQILILLVIYFITLSIIGVPNPFIIAFLCALLNLIPYLGPIIGVVLISFLTMTSFIDSSFVDVVLPKTVYAISGFIFGQLIDNFISQPYIFSKSVKSHPLEIFIIIVIAGTLFGTLGLIFAIPTYTSLKVMLKVFFEKNKFVDFLTKNI
jgi:predicted PurR-regulated permease PerM